MKIPDNNKKEIIKNAVIIITVLVLWALFIYYIMHNII